MAATDNPLAKAAYAVAKGVRKNAAVLHYRYAPGNLNSRSTKNVEFLRNIWIMTPEPVSEYLVSSGVYVFGDMKTDIPSICLQDALVPKEGDPVIKIRNEEKTLPEIRQWSSINGGVNVTSDILEWGGIEYRIVKIEPQNFWFGEPSKFRVILRGAV